MYTGLPARISSTASPAPYRTAKVARALNDHRLLAPASFIRDSLASTPSGAGNPQTGAFPTAEPPTADALQTADDTLLQPALSAADALLGS
jgi:hypothetical protein